MNNEEKIIFIKEYYGEEAQANQAVQELAELIIGITKNDLENIKEEIADVEIMIEQFKLFKSINIDTYNEFKESIKTNKKHILQGVLENNLQLICLELAANIKNEDSFRAITNISKLEILISAFIDMRNINRNEIEEIKDRKLKRQIKRIEDSERNKKIAAMRKIIL